MRSRIAFAGALALVGFGLTACTRESPSEIGGPLLPPGDVSTFEIILEPADFLAFDTAFSGYAHAAQSPVLAVARKFEGVTDANTLVRLGTKPTSIQVRDAGGSIRTDTLPIFKGGTLVMRVDTFRSTKSAVRFGLYRTAEGWDQSSANWTMRVDTGGVHLPWTTPGGTRGPVVSSVRWTPGTDSLVMNVDSQTVAALTDPADTLRGVLIAVDSADLTNGARLRVTGLTLHIPTGSTVRPDTSIVTDVGVQTSTFIFTPDPAATASAVRVSGVPAWRGILSLMEGFENKSIPCPVGPTGCVIRLRDVHLNSAELLFRPAGSPPGFAVEDSISVAAHSLLRTDNVPLARSPIGDPVGKFRSKVAPTRFRDTDQGPEVPLPVTTLIQAIMSDTTSATSPNRPTRHIALITAPDPGVAASPQASTFGIAAFKPGPRLRLVLTATTEQR